MTDISLLLVFAAGLLSFLSPCVLPLIPSYLSILGGIGLEKNEPVREARFRPRLVLAAFAFVLGLSTVFIALSILASSAFFLVGGTLKYINAAAGIIVIVLGINVIFDFLSFLNYEKRPFFAKAMQRRQGGSFATFAGAFAAGAAFAAGWTPCIGPVLAGILLMAVRTGKTAYAVWSLAVYSAGLSLPFLLAALFFDLFVKNTSRLRRLIPLIRRISGILLVIIGILIVSGQYSTFNSSIQRTMFNYIAWAEAKPLLFRLTADWLSWLLKF